MNRRRDPKHWLQKKAPDQSAAYPFATITYYGPNDQFASKAVVAIRNSAIEEEPAVRMKWHTADIDARQDPSITQAILEIIGQNYVQKVAIVDRIAGCPHEAGIDYPEGGDCPQCPFWAHHRRRS